MKYSKLPRLYIKSKLISNSIVALDSENIHYIKKVLRIREGEKIRVFNEDDGEYFSALLEEGKNLFIRVEEKFEKNNFQSREWSPEIVLMASIVKTEKFEIICDMATQLGVTAILPIVTERTQKKELNYVRLAKIIKESVRQSERIETPALLAPKHLSEIDFDIYDIIYLANEMENSSCAPDLSKHNLYRSRAVIVGPEGGFTQDELQYLTSLKNLLSISLGPFILRSETACAAILARCI
ncbi:MAG: RsmE family RNA methyltransferase [Rickettsiaceae bacterium]|nr:RsmE family RNA methyltransferase [Rickettsiaceae bacterium]